MILGSRHVPVLPNEAIEALNIRSGCVYVDCTFGAGGHSRLILERLAKTGRLIALDKDSQAVALAKKIKDTRFQVVHGSFAVIEKIFVELGASFWPVYRH